MSFNYTDNERELFSSIYIPLQKKISEPERYGGTVEIIDGHITLDPSDPYIDLGLTKKAPRKYIKHELDWYLSMDRHIEGHEGIENNPIWNQVKSKTGRINSNYGWMVFSPENGNKSAKKSQYDYALEQLISNSDTRQSVCFYNRPSMQWEWNDDDNAKHDFTCTFQTQQFIRKNKLYYIINQRSCDCITGLIPDFAWHCYVYNKFIEDLKKAGKEIEVGKIYWNYGSVHCYERWFETLQNAVEEFNG